MNTSASKPAGGNVRRILKHEDYTIACLCPMGIELAPVEAMLDEIHVPLPTVRDHNSYTLGTMGPHNVAIVVLPHIGNNAAVAAVVHLMHDFPSIRFGVLVGIGGGVPGTEELHLGDVVVSQPRGFMGGVVQYDMGKLAKDGFSRTGMLNKPPAVLLASVEKLKAQHRREGSSVARLVDEMVLKHASMAEYAFPGRSTDMLFDPSYAHIDGTDCSACDRSKLLLRKPRIDDQPCFYYGTIGSANSVLKNAQARDRLRDELEILAVEMEAAGTFESFPCLVVRGICDYADTHKSKVWQPYAAAIAAGYVRELLLLIPPRDVTRLLPSKDASSSPSINQTECDFEPGQMWQRPRPNILDGESNEDKIYHNQPAGRNAMVIDVPNYTHPGRLGKTPHSLPQDLQEFGRDRRPVDAIAFKLILDSLRFDNMDSRHANIKPGIAHSCRWLLTNTIYQAWLDARQLRHHHGFLWIRGKPAAGKSTLMKFALAECQENEGGELLLSFFFNARGGDLEKSVEGMYRSLLAQLLEHDDRLLAALGSVVPLSDTVRIARSWTIPTMQAAMTNMIKMVRARPLTMFIDALDESDEDEVRNMVTHLEDLAEVAVLENITLRICFSSRHYPYISPRNGLEIILEKQAGHQQDITTYVETRLKGKGNRQWDMVRSQILTRCSGVFLWVVLVVEMLNKAFDRGRIHAMQRRFDEIPSDLHTLFEEILMKDRRGLDELRICLWWISYAFRPLSPEELCFAILSEVDPVGAKEWNFDSMNQEIIDRYVIDCSKGIGQVTTAGTDFDPDIHPRFGQPRPSVQFIHQSVKDFLIKEGGLGKIESNPIDDWTIFEAEVHDRLKKFCYNIILSQSAELNMTNTTDFKESQSRAFSAHSSEPLTRHPFESYAARFLLHHADAAEARGISQVNFVKHLSPQVLCRLLPRDDDSSPSRMSSLVFYFVRYNLEHLVRMCITSATDSMTDFSMRDDIVWAREPKDDLNMLSVAAEFGSRELVQLLLATSWFDLRQTDACGRTALLHAAGREDSSILELLIQHSMNSIDVVSVIDFPDSEGTTPLIDAAAHGQARNVELLLRTGVVNIRAIDSLGRTPLLAAVLNGNPAVLELLLTIGHLHIAREDLAPLLARVIRNTTHSTLLGLKEWARRAWRAKLQLEGSFTLTGPSGVSGYEKQPHDFLVYAGTNEEQTCAIIKLFLEGGKLDLLRGSRLNETPLQSAVKGRFRKISRLLVDAGADVDELDAKSKANLSLLLEGDG